MLFKIIKDNYLIAIIIIFAAILLSINLNKPFIGHHDFNGVFWGNQVRVYLDSGASLKEKLNLDYLPLLPLLFTVSSLAFGLNEVSLRLVPLVFSLLLTFFIYKTGKLLFNKSVGILAAALTAATPMFLYFGKLPDHEPVVVALVTVAFFAFIKDSAPKSKYHYLFIAFLLLSLIESWPAFFIIPPLVAFYFFTKRRKQDIFLPLALGAVVIFMGVAILVYSQGPSALSYLANLLLFRMNLSQNPVLPSFTTGQFVNSQAHLAVAYFTRLLIILSAFWLLNFLWKLKKKNLTKSDWILSILFIYPLSFVLVMRQLVFIHDYKLYHFLPFVALSSAYSLNLLLNKLSGFLKGKIIVLFSLVIIFLVATERIDFLKDLLSSSASRDGYELGILLKDETKPADKILVLSGQFGSHFGAFTNFYSQRQTDYQDYNLQNFTDLRLTEIYDWIVYIEARDTPVEVKDNLLLNYKELSRGPYLIFKTKSD